MDITALLLADSWFPGGGHAHSGGLEEAALRGLVSTEDDLRPFLFGRLWTAGELAAVFAAAAAYAARRGAGRRTGRPWTPSWMRAHLLPRNGKPPGRRGAGR